MQLRGRRRRRGVALLAAMLALVCVSALLVGTAAIATELAWTSVATHAELRAFLAAERGLWTAYASLDDADLALPVGATRALARETVPEGVAALTITRIAPTGFMIVSDASFAARGGAVWRRLGLFATAGADTAGAFWKSPLPDRSWVELP